MWNTLVFQRVEGRGGLHADRTRGEAATKGGREDERGVVHTAQLGLARVRIWRSGPRLGAARWMDGWMQRWQMNAGG